MIKNSFWSFIGVVSGQFINLLGNIILARILYPQLFGLLGIASLFYGLILVIQEAGFSAYIIYKKNISKQDLTACSWLNIVLSTVFSMLFYFSSNIIVDFYHESSLKSIVGLLSIGMVISAFGITGRALLTKEKRFNKLAQIDVLAQVVSVVSSVLLAVFGLDFLAISARFLILPFVQTICILYFNAKRVFGKSNLSVLKKMLPYSLRVLGINVFIYINNNLDYFLIGNLLGSKQLGLYTIAYQWSVFSRFYIAGSINRVLFPEISSIKNNIAKVREIFLDVTNTISFFTFPMCFGLIAIGSDFIIILYGTKWTDSIDPMRILLVAGALTSIGTLSGSLFQGLGKPQIELKFNILSFFINIILICLGSKVGLVGVSCAIMFSSMFLECVKSILISRLMKISLKKYLTSFIPNLTSSFIMFGVIIISHIFTSNISIYLRVFIDVAEGILLYLFLSYLFNKHKLIDVVELCKKFYHKWGKQ